MTREERENAIRHIETALDVDPWAKERAIEALRAGEAYKGGCKDGKRSGLADLEEYKREWIEQMRGLYEDTENGTAGEFARGWKKAIDACVAILRGLER